MWMGGFWKFQVEPCHGTGNKMIENTWHERILRSKSNELTDFKNVIVENNPQALSLQ
mgnify:FL=1